MANQFDYTLPLPVDGALVINLAPPAPVGGWSLRFTLSKRQGGTSLLTAYAASGFYGSGITLQNSGEGIIRVSQFATAMSGQNPGAYVFELRRTDSGFANVLSFGYRVAAY